MNYTVLPGSDFYCIVDTPRGKRSVAVVAIYVPPFDADLPPLARLLTGEVVPMDTSSKQYAFRLLNGSGGA